MWILLLSCLRREPSTTGPAREISVEADRLWAQRDELGLEAVGAPLISAQAVYQGGPGIAWRLSRWYVARGLAEDDPAVAARWFADARESAVACLDQSPEFAAWHAAGDWEAAAKTIPVVRRPCAAWAAFAWVRWMEVHGPVAASLDFPAIDVLIAAGEQSEGPMLRDVAEWARALADALRPAWLGGDLQLARAELGAVVRSDPDSVARRVDQYRLVLARIGTAEERAAAFAAIAALTPRYPEDIRLQQRFTAPP
jgi:hypothetical protein